MALIHDLVMPKLGLTMTEGMIVEWKVESGGTFAKGDILLVVETDKVTYEVEAESDGVMVEIRETAGKTVPVGLPIACWRVAEASTRKGVESHPPEDSDPCHLEGLPAAEVTVSTRASSMESAETSAPRISATPLARRLAHRFGIDLSAVRKSGSSGKIRAEDVKTAATRTGTQTPPSEAAKINQGSPADLGVRAAVDRVRAAMARRLTLVKQEVPHFYLASEAEVSALLTTRDSLNAEKGVPRITINHMILAAVGRTLLDLPHANKVWADGCLTAYRSTNVGFAVHTSHGLFVPILRDAGRLTVNEVANRAHALSAKARSGRLLSDEMSGGAMAVSNAGMFNVTYLTPIINPGHSAILGVGSVRQLFRPDEEGNPSRRQEIGLVLACDHRVFDGVAGLEILNRIISYLENPSRLLSNSAEPS